MRNKRTGFIDDGPTQTRNEYSNIPEGNLVQIHWLCHRTSAL